MKRAATEHTALHDDDWPQVVIIGYGNSLRRDDGAGIVLAGELATHLAHLGLATKLITGMQLLPEMAAELSHDVSAVIFVDTSADSVAKPVAIIEIDVDTPTASTGHQLTPATLLVYAALLYGRSPHALLVTLPGVDFGHGEGFSRQVATTIAQAEVLANGLYESIRRTIPCTN
jgi:hydrogenase maturation protease